MHKGEAEPVISYEKLGKFSKFVSWVIAILLISTLVVPEISKNLEKESAKQAAAQSYPYAICADAKNSTYGRSHGSAKIEIPMKPQCFGGETTLPVDWPRYDFQ